MPALSASASLIARALATFLTVCGSAGAGLQPKKSEPRPRLAVLISIDQFRADYLVRFEDLFLPARDGVQCGGFRYLMEAGAWYSDARHEHFPLFTGPGHAVLSTGAHPGLSGIVGNHWGNRKNCAEIYCVFDAESAIVGPGNAEIGNHNVNGVSPRSLRVSTIGDELEIATGRRAKVWSIAFKDRAAVLLAGHLADGAVWFDGKQGCWASSRWYFKDRGLPSWADTGPCDTWTETEWTASLDDSVHQRVWLPDNPYFRNTLFLGPKFPHALASGPTGEPRSYQKAYTGTPFGNRRVLELAERIVAEEDMGADEVPDLLLINLSSNDYVGHAYGPDSPEVLEMTVATDRLLAEFMNAIASVVPYGLEALTFVISADHGVSPIPEAMLAAGFHGGRFQEVVIESNIKAALADRLVADLDPTTRVCNIIEWNLYLNEAALTCTRDEAAEIAAGILRDTLGIAGAFTRADVLHGRIPPTDEARRVAVGYHGEVSGDVVFFADPYYLSDRDPNAASHGSPYTYDACVPILFAGCGVRRPGRCRERVSTFDIAATLADLLGTLPPSGCVGRVLPHAGLEPEPTRH